MSERKLRRTGWQPLLEATPAIFERYQVITHKGRFWIKAAND